jgi:hypothetical protein
MIDQLTYCILSVFATLREKMYFQSEGEIVHFNSHEIYDMRTYADMSIIFTS